MKERFKKYWLISLISFHSINVIGNLLIPLIDDWCIGWWNGAYFKNPNNLWSVLFLYPFIHISLAILAYYFVYRCENKYSLKLVMILTFLLTSQLIHNFYDYAHYDWSYTGCPIAIMTEQALFIYTGIFYCLTSFYWYYRINKKQSFKSLIGCIIGFILLILTTSILYKSIGWITIFYFCLPDCVQNIFLKNNLIAKAK